MLKKFLRSIFESKASAQTTLVFPVKLRNLIDPRDPESTAAAAHALIAEKLQDAVARDKILCIDMYTRDGFSSSFLYKVFNKLPETTGLDTKTIKDHLYLGSSRAMGRVVIVEANEYLDGYDPVGRARSRPHHPV